MGGHGPDRWSATAVPDGPVWPGSGALPGRCAGMITGTLHRLPHGRQPPVLRQWRDLKARRLGTTRAPELTLYRAGHGRPERVAAFDPLEDERRFPVYLGHLPDAERLAAARVTVTLARAARPAVHVFTPEDVVFDAEMMRDGLAGFLQEVGLEDQHITPELYARAVHEYDYDGGDPFALQAHLDELDRLPDEQTVLEFPGPIGDAMRLAQQVAHLTQGLTPTHGARDAVAQLATEDTGPWTVPLLTTQFTRDPDIEALIDELHQEHHQLAMEVGRTHPTAAYRLDRPDQRRQLDRLLARQGAITALVLRAGERLLDAGGRQESTAELARDGARP